MKKDASILGLLGIYLSLDQMGLDNPYSPAPQRKSESGGMPNNPKKIIPNGCKEYRFYGITVIAANEKSALKKCAKRFEKLYGRKP